MNRIVGALTVSCLAVGPVAAADFYAGKSVSILVGAGAGGSYDVYARALANHIGKHV
ncbi:MAG: hypothetical protein RJB09_908, partial [Pseudomonadota bacterium]